MKKIMSVFLLFGVSLFLLNSCTDPNTDPSPTDNGTGTGSGTTSLTVNATLPGGLSASILGGPVQRAVSSRAVTSIDIPVEYPAGTAVGTISLTTVRFVLKEFKLEMEGSTSDSSYEFQGPYVVDLIAETMDPVPAETDLADGTYTQLKFKIDKIEGDETDDTGTALIADTDPLFGHSMLLEGTYTPTGGTAVPFTCTYDADAEFELTPSGDTATGFTIGSAGADIIVAFRLVRWFEGINPAAFAADPSNFAEDLKENIKLSADYGEDQDGDGELSSSEDDDPDEEDTEDD